MANEKKSVRFSGLADLKWDEEEFREGIRMVCSYFNVEELRREQITVLRNFFQGKNVYFSAPTGFGKSLIFQAIPLVADHLLGNQAGTSIILVISPLQSLMFDQVKYLKETVGLNAVAIHKDQKEEVLREIEEGVHNLIYASPESMLSVERWRNILSSEMFQENCVGVVVDEAHCISQWGYSTSKKSPFRKWYKNLSEFRSLLGNCVKFAVFTATVTTITKTRIFEILCLDRVNTYCLELSPLKKNIKYSVLYAGNELSIETIFSDIAKEISDLQENTQRTLIYCQTRTQCALLWRMFMLQLGDKLFFTGKPDPKLRLIEMFHAGTPSQVKDFIVTQTSKMESHLRVLICTIAFGMGIDCKCFNRVIHFGPSKNLESYIQECGRVGRDGNNSISYLIYNGLLTSKCSDDMKEFVHSKECRRECISKNFVTSSLNDLKDTCSCCDICAMKCLCSCSEKCIKSLQLSFNVPKSSDSCPQKTRNVTTQQKKILEDKLLSYKEQYRKSIGQKVKPISCPGIFVEFTDFQVHQVLKYCQSLFTLDDVLDQIEIWRAIHAKNILVMLSEVFSDIESDKDDRHVTFEACDSDDNEVQHDWLEVRDDSHFSVELDSGYLQDVDTAMEDLDRSEQCHTEVTDMLGSNYIKSTLLNKENDDDMDVN